MTKPCSVVQCSVWLSHIVVALYIHFNIVSLNTLTFTMHILSSNRLARHSNNIDIHVGLHLATRRLPKFVCKRYDGWHHLADKIEADLD